MNSITPELKLLFVINPGSGNHAVDFEALITEFFNAYPAIRTEQHLLGDHTDCHVLKQTLLAARPDRIVAVGGDGTIKLLAEILTGTDIPLGIVPAGSANGMAKELRIPLDAHAALKVVLEGSPHRIHLVRINGELCIHLSDIGFNAYVVKTFDAQGHRGMLGYIKAAWKVLWRHSRMKAVFSINNRTVERKAVMIVVANATSYGTGIRINPEGRLDDDLFEVVIVRKISLLEIFKMAFTRRPFNPRKTELFQTRSLLIRSRHKAHFQVDGEYRGKVNELRAELLPAALSIIY
ncbi:diacylglycerol/lipid kinase family protein [Taibaiella koreensis]|uniref:diacylglycerol/lipid kinase family protein n=1 Tax=Taibaiella koreensis TaxID=1268548 RepID=UPI000E59F2B9|nr:diacylglycerol kinase family protein [Taibaiella koreensis]